ncbi:MAG TPA: hypothetical protein VF545_04105, partial [Thermoleophilaceae bacterium]
AAAPWPDLQRASGSYRDMVRWPTPYGEAILGYGLLGVGVREHDRRLIDSAMRAFDWVLEHRAKRAHVSVFQNWSMAAAYDLARRTVAGNPRFEQLRPRWLKLLRRQQLRRLKTNRHYGNHQLVEALEVLELQRTGLRSSFRRGAIGPNRREYLARALHLLNRRIPEMAAGNTTSVGGRLAFLLSDPPDQPMAYQGLSLGLYARGVDLLGSRARPAADGVLRRVTEASWRLAAPDGDLGYMGRNSEQAWILSGTAFGAHETAALGGGSRTRRAQFEGLAVRALQRLAYVHLGGPEGMYIIPALRQDYAAGKWAADFSAGSGEFTGLTLLFLNYLADSRRSAPAPAGVAGDANGTQVLGRRASLRAVVRHGDVWFATRARSSFQRPGDLRYDPGLIALKHRHRDGIWRDVIPLRPRVSLDAPANGSGPLLRTAGGRAALAAKRIERRPGGAVELIGGYRRLGSAKPIGRKGVQRIEPLDCGGAQVAFSARAGDRLEYSVFLRESPGGPTVGPDHVVSGGTRVTFSPGAEVELRRGFVSASNPFVMRVRLRWTAGEGRLFKVAICDQQ